MVTIRCVWALVNYNNLNKKSGLVGDNDLSETM